jgi:hypothetical protein
LAHLEARPDAFVFSAGTFYVPALITRRSIRIATGRE